MTKRGYITWVPTSERLPEEAGMYIITRKKYGPDNIFGLGTWDGKETETGFDRYLPVIRNSARGQWWSVRDSDVLAWAELPKPYKTEEEKG